MTTPALFTPLTLRGVTLKNRIAVSPMCQYSATDGVPNDWHFVHLGRFAIGGAGLVMVEATAVEAEGRITHGDLGLWNDEQQGRLARIAAFLKSQGAVPAIQIGHAGRKASTHRPFEGGHPITTENARPGESAWQTVAPSAIPFADGYHTPRALTVEEIHGLTAKFVDSAKRALAAGFEVLEIHGAHGYLLTEFLSPISNHRSDQYGGDFQGRTRFLLETVEAVRAVWPDDKPLFVRLSTVDGTPGGWSLEDSVVLAGELKARGVDVIDSSSGGLTPSMETANRPAPLYQTPYAEAVRRDAGIATMAVGLITQPQEAEAIIADGQADIVALGRAMLENPNWAQDAKAALDPEHIGDDAWPLATGYAVKSLKGFKAKRGLA
ncbi:NADH:flavin oxidoreductase/NADH oxidase [Caulobacter sp. NIBR2454]|uniref:NADH:flavin oxidoreductase/NADH oxidase n=1 Tax=Caulobacter sp. NIBR2454 TaxID=3015996 RepID=UPI0022B65619|nr:NADH:flavin oxidoreductase/NADH oxidase [Caulobacter sp. NIBR2454]